MSVHPDPVPPMAKYKGINVNLKSLPKARSSNKWYKDKDKRKTLYVLCASLLCVLIIAAIFTIPIVLTIELDKTVTTASTGSTSSTLSTTMMITVISTNSLNMTNTTTTTTSATTTTVCPNMTCAFSSIAAPMTSTYGVEHLNINCTQTLLNMTISIIVQRTVNATYANQYQTFWNLTTNQTYIETNSQIIYTWTLLPGQVVEGIGFPYFVEGQYFLPNVNQTTSLDTYSATFISICGTIISQNGTF